MKKDSALTLLNSTLLLVLILISGYICIGGLSMIEAVEKVKIIEKKVETPIVRKITFNKASPETLITQINVTNKALSRKELTFEDEESIKELEHVYWYYGVPKFSYIRFLLILPYTVLLFLTVGCAGALGSCARIIIDHSRNIISIKDAKIITYPMFGFFMGIIVLAISYIIPSVFVRGDTTINTTAVVLICFFSGVFGDAFYAWIVNHMDKFLLVKKPA